MKHALARLAGLIAMAALGVQAAMAATLLPPPSVAAARTINAVPPAHLSAQQAPAPKAAPVLLAPAAPALHIVLAPPSPAERKLVESANRRGDSRLRSVAKARPLAVAYGRDVPLLTQVIPLASLPWQVLPDGGRVAHLDVRSPGAAAVRIALALNAAPGGVSLRYASAGGDRVFGPVPAADLVAATQRYGRDWSPVVEGDTITVEVHAAHDASLAGAVLTVSRVSHLVAAPASLRDMSGKDADDIGRSDSCEIDVKCQPQTDAFVKATRAVAKIIFTQDDGGSYLCTGQLLADSTSSLTPYFFSANHCLDSALAAHTIDSFWFFDAPACGQHVEPAYVELTSGATLLARSDDWDWALVRLNETPPLGATFSAWRAEPIATGSDISVIHHPEGDLKKWSHGTMPGVQTYSDGSSFWFARYLEGTTEPGSSGAGLLTYNGAAGYFELRGGLYGGDAACSSPGGLDQYSQLGNMLPKVREYLTPDANPAGTVAVVEFYNRGLDHYFMSASPAEIHDLDTGVHAGWERTGLRFNAYATAIAGTSPVCRFYRAPAFGDSHFYSASPAECEATAAAHPLDWIYESPAVFYIALPDKASGACAPGTQPVWRFFNQRTTNHRYTAEVAVHDRMVDDPVTWLQEGYGPSDPVIMCAPLGS